MKKKSIVKEIDAVGRLVIPKGLRSVVTDDKIGGSLVKVYAEDDKIIIEKAVPACVFCGSEENLKDFNGKPICINCIKKIVKSF